MKQTTKPNTKQSHLLKRDLARNVAALPLPTPPAGAWGEGRRSVESGPDGAVRAASSDALDLINFQFPQFTGIASRRDEPLSLSQGTNQSILTLTTDYRLPNV